MPTTTMRAHVGSQNFSSCSLRVIIHVGLHQTNRRSFSLRLGFGGDTPFLKRALIANGFVPTKPHGKHILIDSKSDQTLIS